MTAKEAYQKYNIPPNLQLHMVRVASLGEIIVENWKGPQVDKDLVVKTCLLHDMGNIIKFEIDKGIVLLGEEAANINFWKNIQKQFRDKYGEDEHQATYLIAKELRLFNKGLFVLKNIGSSNLYRTLDTDNWHIKLCSYPDMRISPNGIVSINKRFDDVISRYKNRAHVLADIEKTEQKRGLALKLEKQIQRHVSTDLSKITNEDLEKNFDELYTYEI